MNGLVLCLFAALAAASPKPEIRNVRISSPKVFLSREKSDSEVKVVGQFKVEMAFAAETVKKPVMRLLCLSEVDGKLIANSVFIDKPNSFTGMGRSEIDAALKRGQPEAKPKELERQRNSPEKFTPFLSEVTGGAFASAVYGKPDLGAGFFRLGRADKMPKLLQFRIEVWQNGSMAAKYASGRSGLAAAGVPGDWYVWGKYPQKITYSEVR